VSDGPAIRDARSGDLAAVVAIYNATIPTRLATADLDPVPVTGREAWFDAHDPGRRPLWVAEADGAVVGWLSLEDFHERPAYGATAEVSVYVAEAARGRGVGRTLLGHLLERAPGLGVERLVALVFAHNAPSLGLFAAVGFERWGELPDVAVLDGVRRSLAIVGRAV
jgi:L-amino acid N-acyltransferase YncA